MRTFLIAFYIGRWVFSHLPIILFLCLLFWLYEALFG